MLSLLKKCSFFKKTIHSGFTLIEMIVVLAIFGILTSIIMFNYGAFSSNILLTNTAYEIALQTREAQFFGLGARGVSINGVNDFRTPYGIYVNVKDGSAPNSRTKNIIMFSDFKKNANGNTTSNLLCDGVTANTSCTCSGTGDECIEKITTTRQIVISKIYYKSPGNGNNCNAVDELAITFKRPNPDAIILEQGQGSNPPPRSRAIIQLESPNLPNKQYVIINETGQISVANRSETEQQTGCTSSLN